jgi:subtilase family serine protease
MLARLRRRAASALRSRTSRQVRRPLRLEELETRTLLSASPVMMPHLLQSHAIFNGIPSGYTPYQIRAAYGLNNITFHNGAASLKGNGAGQTIAIVDAFDDPTIAADLKTFDAAYGLPNPTFTKLNQTGGTTPPPVDAGWALEISLDVEWAHALAPAAKILLVEANSAGDDLFTAVSFAANYSNVSVVSMSWGSGEFSGENTYDPTFTTPNGHNPVTFVASTGDSGAPPSYPAISPSVLGVGGTTLNLNNAGGYKSEKGWVGSGGGVSTQEPEPSYQLGVQTTGFRTNPDISFDADPNTGVGLYDTTADSGYTGWFQVGGTSFSSPSIAALLAITNQGRVWKGLPTLQNTVADVYSIPASDFHDIITGNNGYGAHAGYDYVTGIGSPKAPLVATDLSNASSTAPNPGSTPNTLKKSPPPMNIILRVADPATTSTLSASPAVSVGTTATEHHDVPATFSVANTTGSSRALFPVQSSGTAGPRTAARLETTGEDALPDGEMLDSTPPDGQGPAGQPMVPAGPAAPMAPAAPVIVPDGADAVFSGPEWTGSDAAPVELTAPMAETAEMLDPAAAIGLLFVAGGYWQAHTQAGETRTRRLAL